MNTVITRAPHNLITTFNIQRSTWLRTKEIGRMGTPQCLELVVVKKATEKEELAQKAIELPTAVLLVFMGNIQPAVEAEVQLEGRIRWPWGRQRTLVCLTIFWEKWAN
jgi:hypothetical protein